MAKEFRDFEKKFPKFVVLLDGSAFRQDYSPPKTLDQAEAQGEGLPLHVPSKDHKTNWSAGAIKGRSSSVVRKPHGHMVR
jgi:hypothetical protein